MFVSFNIKIHFNLYLYLNLLFGLTSLAIEKSLLPKSRTFGPHSLINFGFAFAPVGLSVCG